MRTKKKTKTMQLRSDIKYSLYSQLENKFLEAKQNGNLVFDQACYSTIDDDDATLGMELWLSYAPSFAKKPERGDTPKNEDPLGKYEPELLVSDSIDTTDHFRLVLNKFAIVPNHSLLVTNEIEDQQSHLTREELLTCYEFLRALETKYHRKHIIIYNCGPQSGSLSDTNIFNSWKSQRGLHRFNINFVSGNLVTITRIKELEVTTICHLPIL